MQNLSESKKELTLSLVIGGSKVASLTADPGAVSLILARSYTFVEIDQTNQFLWSFSSDW